MNHAHAVLIALATASSGLGCSDTAPGSTVMDRPPALALSCEVTRPTEVPTSWDDRWWFEQLATTTTTTWSHYATWSPGESTLAPLDATGALGTEVVLDPDGGHTSVLGIAAEGDLLGVLFQLRLDTTVPATSEHRFVALDADGRATHAPTTVPDGELVGLGDGTFGLLSLDFDGDPAHPDLVLRVLDAEGAVVAGPTPIVTLPWPSDFRTDPFVSGQVIVTPVPGGFAVSWWDGDARKVARFDRAGALALGPTTPGGTTDLVVGDTLWVSWVAGKSVHVAAIGPDAAARQAPVVTTSSYLGSPALFEVHGHPVLAWSQGPPVVPSDEPRICGGCYGKNDLHVVALDQDGAGDIVPASVELVLHEVAGGLSLVGVAASGDDLLLAMTATGHAWWGAALGGARCAPVGP